VKITEILTESLSQVAYHYTNVSAAAKILQTGEFQLSSVYGSVEAHYAPPGQPFFFSTTRTRHGGYHTYVGRTAAMFVLDGQWFNQRYKSRPVDYWLNRSPDPNNSHTYKTHEAEDRVFSKNPNIPLGGVESVHILVSPDAEGTMVAQARQAIIAAKRRGIPVYYYEDESSWRQLDTRHAQPVSRSLVSNEPSRGRGGYSRPKGYLYPWVELMQAQNVNHLSDAARRLEYSIKYTYDQQYAVRGLDTDIGNARKPSSGPDRENAVKIIRFMQANRIGTIKDFVVALANKWKSINSQEAQ
jgi:hypothetical protein